MFRALFRVILMVVIGGALLWFFAPRIFSSAANSLLSSANASVTRANGLAQYIPAGVNPSSKSGNLQINLSGLSADTSYAITLDQGQCGAIAQDLGTATSDNNGNLYIELPLASFDTSQAWFVDIHQEGEEGPSVACGQLSTNQTASIQVVSASQGGPNDFNNPQSQPDDQPTPTPAATSTPGTSGSPGLPNTGADPGSNQQYDNSQYPRKY